MLLDSASPIFSLLGNTLVYDEQKGDFRQARVAAETAVASAESAGSSEHLPNALLNLAAVLTLQAECAKTLDICRRVRQIPSLDPATRLRLTAIEMWTAATGWNTYPSGAGAFITECFQDWERHRGRGLIDFAGDMDEEWTVVARSLPQGSAPPEAAFVYHVLAALPAARSQMRHTGDEAQRKQLLQRAMGPIITFLQSREFTRANPRAEGALTLLGADLAFRAAEYDLSGKLVASSMKHYQGAGDQLGEAACHVFWGDCLTGPLYSPLTWHFPIEETSSGDSTDVRAELHEQPTAPQNKTRALEAYAQAETLFRAGGASRGVAGILLRQGYLALWDDRIDDALSRIDAAIELYDGAGDHRGYWLARIHRALASVRRHPALRDLETPRAVAAWGQTDGSYSYALGMGLMLSRAGRAFLVRYHDSERALACFRMATELFRALDLPMRIAQSLADQGAALAAIGDHHAAAADYEDSLVLHEQEAKRRPEAVSPLVATVIDLYRSYEHVADPAGIAIALEWAVKIANEHGLNHETRLSTANIRSILTLGRELIIKGDFSSEALAAAQQTREQLDRTTRAFQLQNILDKGRVTSACYRLQRARREKRIAISDRKAEEALRLARQAKAESTDLLEAIAYAHARKFDSALEAMERHWARPHDQEPTSILSKALATTGADPMADLRNEKHRLETRVQMLARLRQWSRAAEVLEELNKRSKEFGNSWWAIEQDEPWNTHALIAEIHEHTDKLDLALAHYRQALVDLERKRDNLLQESHKLAFSAQPAVSHIYIDAARAALKVAARGGDGAQDAAALGFICIQLNHARSLQDSITQFPAGTHEQQRLLSGKLSVWRSLLEFGREHQSSILDDVKKLMRRDQNSLQELERLALTSSAQDPQDVDSLPPASLAEILPLGTAILQYGYRGGDLLAWAITQDGIVETVQKDLPEFHIDHLVRAHRDRLDQRLRNLQQSPTFNSSGKDDCTDENAAELSDLLLEPFRATIATNRTLIIAPSGPLHRLPFCGLPWDGQPLATTHCVSIVPTLVLLASRWAKPISAASRALVVGCPSNMRFQASVDGDQTLDLGAGYDFELESLPNSAEEARIVANLLSSPALTHGGATRDKVLKQIENARIMHFATHGVLLDSMPFLSAIVLAEGKNISALDILGKHLQADLVFLSACRTGEGQLTHGNDVLGLTRALLAAGARNAIVTLWEAVDVSTMLLVRRFYSLLLAGTTLAEALVEAQMWLRSLTTAEALTIVPDDKWLKEHDFDSTPFKDPCFWAGYQCIGAPANRVTL